MDIGFQTNALKLVSRIANRRKATKTVIDYYPQKGELRDDYPQQHLKRATPESQGISSSHIADFLTELENDKTLNLHSVTILRGGKVISEGYFGAWKRDVPHIMYSMSKTLTGFAIGFMIAEKKLTLNTTVNDVFEIPRGILNTLLYKPVTVRNLLTMSSGVLFNEVGSVTQTDWLAGFNASQTKFDPGKKFHYNSMNSYVLSAMIHELTGENLDEYLRPRLFEPLGISNYCWQKSPTGISKGGWGLYLCTEDLAKLGQMVMDGGKFGGKQVVPAEWIDAMTQKHMTVDGNLGNFDYGYHIWVGRGQPSFLFNGMFGQNIIGYKDSGIIVIITAGNAEFFQQSNSFKLLDKYFDKLVPSDTALPSDAKGLRELRRIEKNLYAKQRSAKLTLAEKRHNQNYCDELNGRKYLFTERNKGVGILPLMTQSLQNNYTEGLERIEFEHIDRELFLDFVEGSESYRFQVGFDSTVYDELNFHGEPYRIGCFGSFAHDEDDRLVLKLILSFIETAQTRIMKLRFDDDSLIAELRELPGKEYISMASSIFLPLIPGNKKLEPVYRKLDPDYVTYKVTDIFEPVIIGKLSKHGSVTNKS